MTQVRHKGFIQAGLLAVITVFAGCASKVEVKKVASHDYSLSGIPFTLMQPRAVVTPRHSDLLQDTPSPAKDTEKTLIFDIELFYDQPDPNERYVINADPRVLSNIGIDLTFGTSGELLGSTETVTTEVPKLINTIASVAGAFVRGGASFDASTGDPIETLKSVLRECAESLCAPGPRDRFEEDLEHFSGDFDAFRMEYFPEVNAESRKMALALKQLLGKRLDEEAVVCEDDDDDTKGCQLWNSFLKRTDRDSLDAFVADAEENWTMLNENEETATEMQATAFALSAISELWSLFDLPPNEYRWKSLKQTERQISELQKCIAISLNVPPEHSKRDNCSRLLDVSAFPQSQSEDQRILRQEISRLGAQRADLLDVRDVYELRIELNEALSARLNCTDNCPRGDPGDGGIIREIRTAISEIDKAISDRRAALAPPAPKKPKPDSYSKGPGSIYYWSGGSKLASEFECENIERTGSTPDYLIVINTPNGFVGRQLASTCPELVGVRGDGAVDGEAEENEHRLLEPREVVVLEEPDESSIDDFQADDEQIDEAEEIDE
ncbi:MAG: hypothetical protein AAF950_06960 [Pseudomonadota bacterium]